MSANCFKRFCGEVEIHATAELTKEEVEYLGREAESIGANLVVVNVQGDGLEVQYKRKAEGKFERVRRITGYLVGTLDRWNSAKQAEEKERVKHSIKEGKKK